ncbi:MAG: tRNA preQ1(34) S-adenosylmethionine ribosyltransferase-isomerase QueA [Eubacteriales bacterium]|nr:tRNA preQ1(34) S-adenosylmethionine ribosyltransferase-isomerase QueA [Eubacteriales bacterium]
MKTEDFDYYMPKELIAQHALEQRDQARMLVVNRAEGTYSDRHFYDIIDYMSPGDIVVLNNSKVIPARIYGTKRETGAHIEFLLHKRFSEHDWEVMARPGKRLKIGTVIDFPEGLSAVVKSKKEDGLIDVTFDYDGDFFTILHDIGQMPLPPYIKEKLKDKDSYNTVYASVDGSSAAPTAGLHFTEELLERIENKGIKLVYVTLHVGLGTFLPVSDENIEDHIMHTEYYEISEEAARIINETKDNGGRVFCIGTTTVRTLEASAANNGGRVAPECRETDLFIYPGFEYKVVDCLLTNFHLPKSTLLMLVCAFYNREKILEAYNYAVREKYRFYSFGDAMLIE